MSLFRRQLFHELSTYTSSSYGIYFFDGRKPGILLKPGEEKLKIKNVENRKLPVLKKVLLTTNLVFVPIGFNARQCNLEEAQSE